MKRAGLIAATVFTFAMAMASLLAIVDRHLPGRGFGEDVMELFGVAGELVSVFYELHLSLTRFLQSFTIVIEVLLLIVWVLAATRLFRAAMGR